MNEVHVLAKTTEHDQDQLFKNLQSKKKSFRFEIIIFAAIWLIAPFLTNRPGQKPLIENMGYGSALLFFGVFLLVPLAITYFGKVHGAVLSCQTNYKRVILTHVSDKVKNPLFHKEEYCLKVTDPYLKKLYFPKSQFDHFQINDALRIEISDNGKQVIKISLATDALVQRIIKLEDIASDHYKKPYTSILFAKSENPNSSFKAFFSFFIQTEKSFFSTIILDLNLLIFICMLIGGVSIYKPLIIDIVRWGGNVKFLTLDKHEYWRLLTNIFVHIGIIHLLMNLLGFIFVSLFIERLLGGLRCTILYLFTGAAASLTSVYWHENVVSAGASGAIFGLYGFFLATLLIAKKQDRQLNGGMISSVLIFIGYNLLMGLTGNIDNAAHIGGLISGFFIGAIMSLTGMVNYKKRSTN
jgi:rhomboid protease GluP